MTLRYELRSGGAGITIASSALSLFERFRQRRVWQREAGGQLFAQFSGPETIIVDATAPGRTDRRWRTAFEPNPRAQREEIRQRFEAGLHFVGDWHSHPEPVPSPSRLDLESMRNCFQKSKHDLKALVLIVIGTQPFPEGLWVGTVSPRECHPLRIATVEPIKVSGVNTDTDMYREKPV
jgi:integrative and conjugative element protein (TIGR02256 family)